MFQNLSAYSTVIADTSYPFKNVPLEMYAQYSNNGVFDTALPKENTTIDGERALRIYGNVEGNSSPIVDKTVRYYVFHDGIPHRLEFYATEKDFHKYLPQFELMVNTLKFTK